MELIKQIIYFILFMVIVYLIFFLLTFKSGGKAELTTKADEIEVPDITKPESAGEPQENSPTATVAETEKKPTISSESQALRYGSRRFMREELWGLYEGPMKGDTPDGFGIFKYDNGDVFLGEYVNGLRSGLGYSLFSKGGVKVREYVDGEKNKTIVEEDLSFLKKKYNNDTGSGSYIGSGKNGLPSGLGAFYFTDGRKYYGQYKNGKREGRGNMVEADGTVTNQKYKDGVLLTN